MTYKRHLWPRMYELLRKKKSLNFISNELGINKSTIYYHYRKLFCKKNKEITIRPISDINLGEFLGIFVGDGSYTIDAAYHHNISFYFSLDENDYTLFVKEFLFRLFGKLPKIYYSYKITVRYSSRLLADFIKSHLKSSNIKSKTVALKNNIDTYSKDFCIGFLRGLLDTDGYVYKCRRVIFSTASKSLNDQTREMLNLLGFEPSERVEYYLNNKKRLKTGAIWGPQYELAVSKERAIVLIGLLQPHNPKRVRHWANPLPPGQYHYNNNYYCTDYE